MHIALFPRWHVGVFEAKGTLSGISGPPRSTFLSRLKPGYPLDCRLSEVDISVFIMFIACLFHPSSVLCFDYLPIVRQRSPTLITSLHLLRTYSIVCLSK